MYIRNLTLVNFRAFRNATFEFKEDEKGERFGVYLLVGVNGVGKSSALDALRLALSHIFPLISRPTGKGQRLTFDDFTIGTNKLSIKVDFDAGGVPFEFEIKAELDDESVRTSSPLLTPTMRKVRKVYQPSPLPLAVYFSPRRSVLDPEPRGESRLSPQTAAYQRALDSRELRLADFVHWLRGIVRFAKTKGPTSERYRIQHDTLQLAVSRLLPGYSNLRVANGHKPVLQIDKGKDKLNVRQLSDGERSVLALVLEVALRLAQANPTENDPLNKSSAVILIDELDLHLHPGWQRDIVERLKATFKQCQIIASTHSAQTIGEVEGKRINLIYSPDRIERPKQAFGMDSNWILQVLMNAQIQNEETTRQEDKIMQLIREKEFPAAKAILADLRREVGLGKESLSRAESMIERHERMQALAQNEKN
ncbi:AAA family ATPase [Hymenobacter saemangeumensis]|uniref:AAA family ATPase n=1 Tax=Hymenobacter saemangeumensis TaxID=1084522 RepID=A0ABP8ICV9_9BACT